MKLLVNFLLIFLVQAGIYGQEGQNCEVPENFYGIIQLQIPSEFVPPEADSLTGIKTGCDGCFQSAIQEPIRMSNSALIVPILVDTRVRRMDYHTTFRLSFADAKGVQINGVERRVNFIIKRWIEIKKNGIEIIEGKKGVAAHMEFKGNILHSSEELLQIKIISGEGPIRRSGITRNGDDVILTMDTSPPDVGMYSIEANITDGKQQHIENWMLSVTDAVFSSPYVSLGACIQGTTTKATSTVNSGVIITSATCDNDGIHVEGWKQEAEKITILITPTSQGVLTGWFNVSAGDIKSRIPFTFMSVRK